MHTVRKFVKKREKGVNLIEMCRGSAISNVLARRFSDVPSGITRPNLFSDNRIS